MVAEKKSSSLRPILKLMIKFSYFKNDFDSSKIAWKNRILPKSVPLFESFEVFLYLKHDVLFSLPVNISKILLHKMKLYMPPKSRTKPHFNFLLFDTKLNYCYNAADIIRNISELGQFFLQAMYDICGYVTGNVRTPVAPKSYQRKIFTKRYRIVWRIDNKPKPRTGRGNVLYVVVCCMPYICTHIY